MRRNRAYPDIQSLSTILALVLLSTFLPGSKSDYPLLKPPLSGTDRATPSVLLTEGLLIESEFVGLGVVSAEVMDPGSTPTAIATGDFDKDGWTDIAAAFHTPRGCALGIYVTDSSRVIDPSTTWDYRLSPFHPQVRLTRCPSTPDLLATGDFDADGSLDVVAASRGGTTLNFFAGDKRGGLDSGHELSLEGAVTALISADVNLNDGLADVIVGITNSGGSRLLVFEGPHGAVNAVPEAFPMPDSISDVEAAYLDEHWAVDLAVAAGEDLAIVSGRYKEESLDPVHRVEIRPATVTTRKFPDRIRTLSKGDFVGSGRTDLAVSLDDGSIAVYDSELDRVYPLNDRLESEDGWVEKIHTSAWTKDDLALVEPQRQRIRILSQPRFEQAESRTDWFYPETKPLELSTVEPVVLRTGGTPTALTAVRLNADALDDLVLGLGSDPATGVAGIVVARTYPMNTFNVDDSQTKPDKDLGDGRCETEDGTCTFMAAVGEANSIPAGSGPTHDLITFSVSSVNEGGVGGSGIAGPTTVDGTTAGRVDLRDDGLSVGHNTGRSVVRGMSMKALSVSAEAIIENNFVQVGASGVSFDEDGSYLRVVSLRPSSI
jgi:hypothetical protein